MATVNSPEKILRSAFTASSRWLPDVDLVSVLGTTMPPVFSTVPSEERHVILTKHSLERVYTLSASSAGAVALG